MFVESAIYPSLRPLATSMIERLASLCQPTTTAMGARATVVETQRRGMVCEKV